MPVMRDDSRHERQRDTRDRILDAALELFSTEGYESATVKRIAQLCGLTDAAIYYYFESKHEILTTLIEERWNIPRGLEQLSAIVDEPDTSELVHRFGENVIDAMTRNERIIRVVVRESLSNNALARRVREARRDVWMEGLLRVLERRVPLETARLLADMLLAVSLGLFASAVRHNCSFADLVRQPEHRARAHAIIRRTLALDRHSNAPSPAT